jgi:hypothetical protein
MPPTTGLFATDARRAACGILWTRPGVNMRYACLALFLLAIPGCGGDPPSSPSVPPEAAGPALTPPPAPSFLDGWTEQALGARIEPAAPAMGGHVRVEAEGYLVRQMLFDGRPLSLWPDTETYVQAFVYGETTPGRRLSRWDRGFAITGGPELLDDGRVRSILEAAAAEASRVSGLPITVAASGPVVLSIDKEDAYLVANPNVVAYAQRTSAANVVNSVRVVFRDLKYVLGAGNRVRTNTVLHEIGHVLGVGHSLDPEDVMHVDGRRTDAREFSERETLTFKMMYRWRRAGNTFPDRAPELGAAANGLETTLVPD